MNSVEILERLVSFPTVSCNSNLALIDYVRGFLSARGLECRLYQDASSQKANLFTSIGTAERAGVLLSGHSDVVPVTGQRWSSDPFALRAHGGSLYARGACDMKGFIACALRAADRAVGMKLQTPLQLAFSYDEEVGCLGVRSLVDDMSGWSEKPRLCIVGEPTLLRAAIGHKGKTALRAKCHGQAAHSANPKRGVNAIYLAADLIRQVRELQAQLEATGVRDEAFEVPYSTLHVGVINGGTALNIVPADCEVELEIRDVPGEDVAGVVRRLQSAGARIDLHVENSFPGLQTSADADVVEMVTGLTGHRERIKVGFGTEAGLFSRLGIDTVVCGPGSIEQAHRPDEFVTAEQLERCDAMLDALLQRLASN
jgi:acetylornithine deacetylase